MEHNQEQHVPMKGTMTLIDSSGETYIVETNAMITHSLLIKDLLEGYVHMSNYRG